MLCRRRLHARKYDLNPLQYVRWDGRYLSSIRHVELMSRSPAPWLRYMIIIYACLLAYRAERLRATPKLDDMVCGSRLLYVLRALRSTIPPGTSAALDRDRRNKFSLCKMLNLHWNGASVSTNRADRCSTTDKYSNWTAQVPVMGFDTPRVRGSRMSNLDHHSDLVLFENAPSRQMTRGICKDRAYLHATLTSKIFVVPIETQRR